MTNAELTREVYRRLREVAGGEVYFSADDITTAINDGYAELADATEFNETWRTLDVLDDRPWYDGRYVLGESLLTVGPAFHEDTNRWLLPTSLRELDTRDTRWEQSVGPAQRVMVRGLWWIGFWPRLGSDSGTVKQYFTSLPAPLAADDDVPNFPEEFQDGPIEFALADLWCQDGETTRALGHWRRYLEIETALQAWVDARANVPRLRGYRG